MIIEIKLSKRFRASSALLPSILMKKTRNGVQLDYSEDLMGFIVENLERLSYPREIFRKHWKSAGFQIENYFPMSDGRAFRNHEFLHSTNSFVRN